MGLEDVLKGATNGYATYFAYLSFVAQEVGMEKAIDIMAKMAKYMGRVQGGMIKKQAGIEEADIKTALSLARAQKMFILTVLGFILGALLGKAGLGLIIGLFLGAAMEIYQDQSVEE